jgi:hypothetical protein
MLGLGFISFEKALTYHHKFEERYSNNAAVATKQPKIDPNSQKSTVQGKERLRDLENNVPRAH